MFGNLRRYECMQIRTDIAPQWRSNCRKSKTPLIILSPYITGDKAFSLVKGRLDSRIYTLFDARIFASGSSEIESIAKLVQEGYQVFHLRNLHAKVVMDGDSFATLGSQNLTNRGSKLNRELSGCILGEKDRETLRALVEPWLNEAKKLSPEMVEDMIKALPDLRKAYRDFSDACDHRQHEIEANELERQLKAQQKAEAKRQSALRKIGVRVRNSVKNAPRSATVKYGKVWQGHDINLSPTLRINKGGGLDQWDLGDTLANVEPKDLLVYQKGTELFVYQNRIKDVLPGRRYLCVLPTGVFGWARVAKTRITKIGRAVNLGNHVLPAFPSLKVTLSAVPRVLEELPTESANLAVQLWDGDSKMCTVPMEFDVSSIRAFKPIAHRPSSNGTSRPTRNSPMTIQFMKWLRENKQVFEDLIWSQVVEDFVYSDGSKLAGINANNFFGPIGTCCRLELVTVRDHPIFDVTPL